MGYSKHKFLALCSEQSAWLLCANILSHVSSSKFTQIRLNEKKIDLNPFPFKADGLHQMKYFFQTRDSVFTTIPVQNLGLN